MCRATSLKQSVAILSTLIEHMKYHKSKKTNKNEGEKHKKKLIADIYAYYYLAKSWVCVTTKIHTNSRVVPHHQSG